MHRAILMLSFVMVLGGQVPLVAQTTSLQVGVTKLEGLAEPEVGVRVSPPAGQAFGIDVSFDVYPRSLAFASLAGMMDLSLAARLRPVPAVALVGRAGGSALIGAFWGGAIMFPGYHGGIGLAVTADARTTVRLDYTYRSLRVIGRPTAVRSVTFGFVVHH
jgi:hypothetical protein